MEPLPAHTIGGFISILFDVRTAVSKRKARINETCIIYNNMWQENRNLQCTLSGYGPLAVILFTNMKFTNHVRYADVLAFFLIAMVTVYTLPNIFPV